MSEISEFTEKTDSSEDKNLPFDLFELFVALLLGLAATGSAWAGFQSSLWGGNQATAYAEAATIAIKAATDKTDAMINIAQDYQIDILGKQILSEAKVTKNPENKERLMDMARYLYTWQMSADAYESLGLPMTKHATQAKEDTEDLSETELFTLALKNDLDDEGNMYEEGMVKGANDLFKKADVSFESGKDYNTRGDRFNLVSVVYTIALFFAGLALVFKTKIRWSFFGAGCLIFLFASYFMITMKQVPIPSF
ncbi:hypothetical protein COW36_04070 [bacterium (Candidatus Blackallbacteria) CG17_big_fil_post_rev_8_21_14_2_50_48_46]|uniref:DUF4337 domain-containing protein n=1 Tax=bacterium (Candidatus Blackallbacteria) CG17_big_fil_post_rev_8_21_14_2_50_48_46 TaxID=2014261 RepID=A0A2M7G9E1_9BACT|nr:MAG: hypothetical protein COW64_04875 [bacterium (Candidatus Blackallbacteria) CG18_big_fil_WC_8_21_14_2_50_49_26]PIW18474.1 MAG: hypothetical protein COW36_04070 [bacterium (Candidatus Blackallbacteria) CG17_big_fil_post_rev_8_21_14_2_50_48_46]PIW46541.1 MAG: hypothetical protein COW20_16610 [bacterium (Candidatus Blackallbacteria) CG13_big_fil_rev_8_21_14_2_50_49_14]